MSEVTIYHNPRCSKSRQTLSLLEEKHITPRIIHYLETPPDAETIKGLLDRLGMNARDLLRKGQEEYKSLGLDNPDLSEDEIIAAMIKAPILIERPIVVANDKAKIGRPPESVLDIL